jgi:hypothetical protein
MKGLGKEKVLALACAKKWRMQNRQGGMKGGGW